MRGARYLSCGHRVNRGLPPRFLGELKRPGYPALPRSRWTAKQPMPVRIGIATVW